MKTAAALLLMLGVAACIPKPTPQEAAQQSYVAASEIVKICFDGTKIYRGPDGRRFIWVWGPVWVAGDAVDICSGAAPTT